MKADANTLGYIGKKPGGTLRDSDSWFTPDQYTNMVKRVLGQIDLDPFSSEIANQHVKASRYFDIELDAFTQTWFENAGTVYMNPPYSRKLIDKSVDLFLENLAMGSITQAIVLVNNATETQWFQKLLKPANALCLVNKRIAFESFDGKHSSGNTRGQIFLYYGENKRIFKKIFKEIGIIVSPC
jgi:phage N-6-adenine-methyltransferase